MLTSFDRAVTVCFQVRGSSDPGCGRVRAAELADADRGKLPQWQLLPQLKVYTREMSPDREFCMYARILSV